MKIQKSLSYMALAFIFAAITQSSPVLAGKQIYPGAQCVRWSGGDVVPRLNSSRIYNDSDTQWMRVDCPILHQNFNATSGNDLDDSDVGVIDNHSQLNASCWSMNQYQIGSTIYGGTGGTRNTSSFGSHEQNLDFGPTGRHPENWYYIGCQIPPRELKTYTSGITYYSGQD
ncbi:MAG: hypothetical protein ACU836_16855 [Gammaproteobacteria bacterium]